MQQNTFRGQLVPTEPRSAGDAISQDRKIIEVRVGELRQLFNAIDPSPFRERDLDPRAEEFIVVGVKICQSARRLDSSCIYSGPPA